MPQVNPFDADLNHARRDGLLLDTNVLAAWVVGLYNPSLLGSKALSNFGRNDFELLGTLAADAARIVTTPHILGEASNLVENCAGRLRGRAALTVFGRIAVNFDERHAAFADLWAGGGEAMVIEFGVTDAAISVTAQQAVVLSTDRSFVTDLQGRGLRAINYNHLRDWLFDE